MLVVHPYFLFFYFLIFFGGPITTYGDYFSRTLVIIQNSFLAHISICAMLVCFFTTINYRHEIFGTEYIESISNVAIMTHKISVFYSLCIFLVRI